MNERVGMAPVKAKVQNLVQVAAVQAERKKHGLPVEPKSMHMIFAGNPGTGKTTVAQDIGKIYNALGLLPSEKVTTVERGDLVGGYEGQSALKTQKVLDKARGGVLFIDEAYNLARDTYGREAMETIMSDMEKNRGSMVTIAAGYPKQMHNFVNLNPGLRSRFPTRIEFPDYSPAERQKIGAGMLKKGQYKAGPKTKAAFNEAIAALPGQGNAREVRNLYEAIGDAHAARLYPAKGKTKVQLQTLTPVDVQRGLAMYQAHQFTSRQRPKQDRVPV